MVTTWLRRNAVVVVLAAIAVGIATWTFTHKPSQAASRRDVAVARARLSACLLGTPVSHIAVDGARLRAIQLAGVADWPKRCAPYAEAVERALPHRDGKIDNAGSRALNGGHVFQNETVDLDLKSLLTPEDDEPILALSDVAREVPRPAAPVVLPHEIPAIAPDGSSLTDVGDLDLGLVVDGNVACRFAAHDGGLEPIAHCGYPADSLMSKRALPVHATAAADLQLVTDDGVRAFATGDKIVASPAVAQAWNVAGTLYAWPADATRASVFRRDASGATMILHVPQRLDESATLVGTQLLWTEHGRVIGVSLAGATTGAVYEVAKAADLPAPDACATSDIAGTLLVTGENQYRVAVFANGAWRVSDVGPRYKLSCAGATVTGLATEPRSTELGVKRIDCNAAGCTASEAKIANVTEVYAVAASGSDTIIVWVDQLVVGLSGPLATLATAKPFTIYDGSSYEHLDEKQFSATALVQKIDVIGRGASAIVAVHADGIRLVHVRNGKPERVAVTFD